MRPPPTTIYENATARKELIVMLLGWYIIYVIFDVASSYWLIQNSPLGIKGEFNPIATFLYQSLGMGGLVVGKTFAFIPMAAVSILTDARFSQISWYRELVETVILSLIGVSSLAALNNFGSILVVQFFKYDLQSMSIWVGLTSIGFSILLTYATMKTLGLYHMVRLFEVIIGLGLILGPMVIWSDLFIKALQLNPLAFIGYVIIMYALVAGAIYLVEEIRKSRNR